MTNRRVLAGYAYVRRRRRLLFACGGTFWVKTIKLWDLLSWCLREENSFASMWLLIHNLRVWKVSQPLIPNLFSLCFKKIQMAANATAVVAKLDAKTVPSSSKLKKKRVAPLKCSEIRWFLKKDEKGSWIPLRGKLIPHFSIQISRVWFPRIRSFVSWAWTDSIGRRDAEDPWPTPPNISPYNLGRLVSPRRMGNDEIRLGY